MNLIENKTKVSKKDISSFLNMTSNQNLWLVVIASVIVALLGFSFEDGKIAYTGFLYLIIAVAILVIYFVMLFVTIKKQTKSFVEIDNLYTFNDDEILILGETQGETEKLNLKYDTIYKVKENKRFIFIYVNKFAALILNKDQKNFIKGDVEKLKSLLEIKLTAFQNQLSKNKEKNKAK